MAKNALKNVIVIGNRVLIKPKVSDKKTQSGLYLPHGVQEKEKIQSGYIIKVGPGYPLPPEEPIEPWEDAIEQEFIPLQVLEGDLAIFILSQSYQVVLEGEKYFIVPQNAILMVQRDEFV